MRLWHKDLIPVLPRKQLLGQWRECCLIAKNIAEKGTPNHLLVNKVMNYTLGQFWCYGQFIILEMDRRGYSVDDEKFDKYFTISELDLSATKSDIFRGWHDNQYLLQCFYNLQEKFDCGGMTNEEYNKIHTFMIERGFRV